MLPYFFKNNCLKAVLFLSRTNCKYTPFICFPASGCLKHLFGLLLLHCIQNHTTPNFSYLFFALDWGDLCDLAHSIFKPDLLNHTRALTNLFQKPHCKQTPWQSQLNPPLESPFHRNFMFFCEISLGKGLENRVLMIIIKRLKFD